MLSIISVVDSISATSMPVNEFVIYRSVHEFEINQAMIVCDTKIPGNVTLPNNIEIYLVGKNKKQIRKIVDKLVQQNSKESNQLVFHLHHQKSALCFFLSTIGMNIRKHTLYTVHSTYSARNLKYKISSCICSLLSNYANCVSKSAFEEYSMFVKKVKKEHFLFVQNGVDVDRIDTVISGKKFSTKSRKELICVGRMIPLKNHQFLIRLMKYLPEYNLVLIGAEDSEKAIRKLAEKEKVIDRVSFLGLLPRNIVFDKLQEASIYVSSSLIEGLPVSVLEAMRVGLIPIISKIKPHQEISEQCKEIIVLPLEEEIWAKSIFEIEKLSEEEYERKTCNIRNAVKSEFSLEEMHYKYMEIYEKLK